MPLYTCNAGGGSGYYLADCSDPAYMDQECPMQCSMDQNAYSWRLITDTGWVVDQLYPDVVYNATTNTWSCCGVDPNGTRVCHDPTDPRTFQAPSPEKLLAAVNSSGPSSSLTLLHTAPSIQSFSSSDAIVSSASLTSEQV